jgi:hypothetical protein
MGFKRICLPPLDTEEERQRVVTNLVAKRHRRLSRLSRLPRGERWVTIGYVEPATWPDMRGWVDQPGYGDPKQRVYYAYLSSYRQRGR